MRQRWLAAGVAIYLLAPAPPPSMLGSWPVTPAGAAALVVAIGAAVLGWQLETTRSRRWAVVMCGLVAGRLLLSAVSPEPGWLARYYGNDSWSGDPQWSSDFRFEGATRIDRTVAFSGAEFPTHYLNGVAFTEGAQREVSEPMSVEWTAAFALPSAGTVAFDVRARGAATIAVNRTEILSTEGATRVQRSFAAGPHTVSVRYRKPAGVEGAISVSLSRPSGEPVAVFAPGSSIQDMRWSSLAAVALDGAALLMLAVTLLITLTAAWHSEHRVVAVVGVAVVTVLGSQGFLAALPFASRFHTLTGGDDWLGFESRARDILQHGLLMTMGQPLGEGVSYFYHPFYSYWIAGLHAIAGESLFAPIFGNFLLLALTALLMWSFTQSLFGSIGAACGLAALLVIFELDFIRYYTITLLSENLYVLTVTLCLLAFAKWARTGRTSALIRAGVWGGLSSVTRPAMLMFFVPALAVVAVIAHRQRHGRWPLQAAIAGTAWMAMVLPFTIRNWIVARKLVLISDGLGGTFIVHNIPAGVNADAYMSRDTAGIASGLSLLWQVAVDHPAAFLSLQVKKLGFTLGLVHWFDGYRPHPELAAITVLYVIAVALSKVMRRPEVWPVHAFVVAHIASMALTSPWNYGYRLILPPYVYMSTLAIGAVAAMTWPALARRARRWWLAERRA